MFRNTFRSVSKIFNTGAMRPAYAAPHFRFYSVDNAAAQGSFLEKDAVVERVVNVVKKHEKVDPSKVTPESHFTNDLALDSLDTTEVVMEIENEFAVEIPDEEAFKMQSVEDVVSYILKNPMAK